jgi:mono/diheme cytochrome c family protein
MPAIGRVLLAAAAAILIAAGVFVAWAWYPAIAAIAPPAKGVFAKARIERGAHLAAIGNCITCHTAENGKPYAGGRPLPTPFGTIYSTNITPDPDTGIGRWSEAAFRRALHQGVDREGRHLYPAFPYDHFTKLTDDDVGKLYAFMMTRTRVRAEAPRNDLIFPLNIRLSIAGWKLLFFHDARFAPDANVSAETNRGKYLVDALAHCGACHTPRNLLMAEKSGDAFSGGSSEGWDAPALNAHSPAPTAWPFDQLIAYLRGAYAPYHGRPLGPMAEVAGNLADAPAADVHAIATYVAGLKPSRGPRPQPAAAPARETVGAAPNLSNPKVSQGAMIYAGACAVCHDNRLPAYTRALDLAFSTSISAPTPRNVIRTVLHGTHPPEGRTGTLMPGYAGALTDAQVSALVTYLRTAFSRRPAWPNVEDEVRTIRQGKDNS